MSQPGIESRIAEIVGSKKALFTGLFDGTTDEVAFERSGSFLSRIEQIVAPTSATAPSSADSVSTAEDDTSEHEIDEVVAAGDESRDVPGAVTAPTGTVPSADEIQRLVAGLIVQHTTDGRLIVEAPPDTASILAALFSGIAQRLQATAVPTRTDSDTFSRSV